MSENVEFVILKGREVASYVSTIAELELNEFRNYPYLYHQSLDDQINYVKRYVENPKSIVVLVMDGDKVVGLSTGIPLSSDTDIFKKPFIDNGISVEKVYYFCETLLLPPYRGRKIYRHFFMLREVCALEHYSNICAFISIERPSLDSKQPSGYAPLDAVWKHFGYEKYSKLFVPMEWKDYGDDIASKKRLVYWLKRLG